LGDTELMPRHFGDVAPVNIFLGENNSGKSRFMREIMKHNPTRAFDFELAEKLKLLLVDARKIMGQASMDNICKIEIIPYASIDRSSRLLDLFNLDIKNIDFNSELITNPLEDIEMVERLLSLLCIALKSSHAFLNLILEDELVQINNQLQGCIFSLKRSSNIYEAQTNGQFNDMMLQDSVAKVTYSSGQAKVSFIKDRPIYYPDRIGFVGDISTHAPKVIKSIVAIGEPILELLSQISHQQAESRIRTYIPTLRTARTLRISSGSTDMLHDTILADYKLQTSGVIINTGLKLFTAIDEKRNADLLDREEFENFQNFLSETFFNGKRVEVVPNRKTGSILVSVDREERELPYLGDGIQAIILLLYPLFIANKGSWFFIEEPETHLHPGFQRLFIKTVATHPVLVKKKLTVFLTTHSNHLLDFAIDEAKHINLFTFRKTLGEAGKTSYQVQLTAPHDLECLTALGVQNSSVFLSNCTIWVEGITDRIYLKAYLKAYLEHRKQTFSLLEGLHYCFLEYAGANVSHYAFGAGPQRVTVTDEALRDIKALSISNRIMLIADQDAGKETKHDRLTSQQHAGFEYVVLPTREIENLLTPEVIVAALKKLYSKQANLFDAGQLKQGQYKSTYLARHLQGKFPDLPTSFVADSGTVASAKKRQFAEAAAEAITSWDMLSDDAKKLAEQVFKFIIGHNPRLGSN
jgi:hypothetical protein